MGGHRQSWGGHFSCLPPFKGAKGGGPPNFFKIFVYQKFPNNYIFKVRKNNHVLNPKYCIIIIYAGGGASEGDSVNRYI